MKNGALRVLQHLFPGKQIGAIIVVSCVDEVNGVVSVDDDDDVGGVDARVLTGKVKEDIGD